MVNLSMTSRRTRGSENECIEYRLFNVTLDEKGRQVKCIESETING